MAAIQGFLRAQALQGRGRIIKQQIIDTMLAYEEQLFAGLERMTGLKYSPLDRNRVYDVSYTHRRPDILS